jgi:hypothetical protein
MPICTKTLVQYGTGAADVFTVLLDTSSLKQEHMLLACKALGVIANIKSRKMQEYKDSVCSVAHTLEKASRRKDLGETIDCCVSESSSLCVRGTVVCSDVNTTVVYGTAVCCVDGKKMDTGIPVVHAVMNLDGIPFAVTSILREDASHTRSASHFISVADKPCVNVRALDLGRRCQSSILWQPMLSHFLRRVRTTDVHCASFCNLGLELQNTQHNATPLFDVLHSQSVSGKFVCLSVFI